jgi:hypothetical protein
MARLGGSDRISINLEGGKELDKLLSNFSRNVERKILKDAVKKALKESVLADIKAAAPRDTQAPFSQMHAKYGSLFQNIRVAATRAAAGGAGAMITTHRAFWGYILERGSRYIQAKPWFLPAFEKRATAIISNLAAQIRAGIESGKYK